MLHKVDYIMMNIVIDFYRQVERSMVGVHKYVRFILLCSFCKTTLF